MLVLFIDLKAAFDSVDRGVTDKGDEEEGGEGRASGEVWRGAAGGSVQGMGGGGGRGVVLDSKGSEARVPTKP